MKINVGIVGYGNLGKSLEKKIISDDNFNLVKIFTRKPLNNHECVDNILNYAGLIDILFLCVGSQSDLQCLALNLVEHFNLIDVYDNHSNLKDYLLKLDMKSKEKNKVCFSALGWDPGIFSIIRGLFSALDLKHITTWGKGVSQGHTNAIKNIDGVVDAIEFTIPNKKRVKHFCKYGEINRLGSVSRLCFVVASRKNHKTIKNKILNMEHYFKGQETKIKFVSQKKLNNLKTYSHKGEIITVNSTARFVLKLKSNPEFTAKIMTTYAKVLKNYIQNENYGAFTVFDIKIGELIQNDKFSYL